MDVHPAPPKPAPAIPAFEEVAPTGFDAEKTEAFDMFRKTLTSDAIAQLADPELGFLTEKNKQGKDVKVEKWKNWNDWTQQLLAERGVPKMKKFDLRSVHKKLY